MGQNVDITSHNSFIYIITFDLECCILVNKGRLTRCMSSRPPYGSIRVGRYGANTAVSITQHDI